MLLCSHIPLTVQRGFKRTEDVGHHSLQEERPVETLIWVNITFELKPYYKSKFKTQFNTIFWDQKMVDFKGLDLKPVPYLVPR